VAIIRMNALAELFVLYKFKASLEDKEHAVDERMGDLLLRLNRYKKNKELLEAKCSDALTELTVILDRFYHHEKRFSKLISEKANTYLRNALR